MRNRIILRVTLEELLHALKLPAGAVAVSVLDCRESVTEGTISIVVDHPSFPERPTLSGTQLPSYTLDELRKEFV